MSKGLNIAFFGSSILSAYWNGAATYYRGIIKALSELGHNTTFYEPNAYGRQEHRDLEDPDWVKVVVYSADESGVGAALRDAGDADIIVKASGVGVFDELLEAEIVGLKCSRNSILFWDVDAPATLDRVDQNPEDAFAAVIPEFDMILTYGGGEPVIGAYKRMGARACIPIYNALDTSTHFPVHSEPDYEADLSFLGNRLPDREQRVEEFFLKPAWRLQDKLFVLGGSGWSDKPMPANVNYVGHVYTARHNAFNCSPAAVLNISRLSMAKYGFSPATRVFEAAGAGACIITDEWEGIESFLEPDSEILVARDGEAVVEIMGSLSLDKSRAIGEAARIRVCNEHTYKHRAIQLERVLGIV